MTVDQCWSTGVFECNVLLQFWLAFANQKTLERSMIMQTIAKLSVRKLEEIQIDDALFEELKEEHSRWTTRTNRSQRLEFSRRLFGLCQQWDSRPARLYNKVQSQTFKRALTQSHLNCLNRLENGDFKPVFEAWLTGKGEMESDKSLSIAVLIALDKVCRKKQYETITACKAAIASCISPEAFQDALKAILVPLENKFETACGSMLRSIDAVRDDGDVVTYNKEKLVTLGKAIAEQYPLGSLLNPVREVIKEDVSTINDLTGQVAKLLNDKGVLSLAVDSITNERDAAILRITDLESALTKFITEKTATEAAAVAA